jgi:hypothetical protein
MSDRKPRGSNPPPTTPKPKPPANPPTLPSRRRQPAPESYINRIAGILAPETSLLCKLGSIVGHTEELLSPHGHDFDRIALDQLLRDPDVVKWMDGMRVSALIPQPRNKK